MGQVHLAETVEVENDGKHVGIPIKEILLRVTIPENRVGAEVGKQRVRMTSQRVAVRLEVLASHVQRDALFCHVTRRCDCCLRLQPQRGPLFVPAIQFDVDYSSAVIGIR